MPRPPKKRFIHHVSDISLFLPIAKGNEAILAKMGYDPAETIENGIPLDSSELEVIRLRHHQGLSQTQAASQMKISQSTFSRILDSAHKKITRAMVEGVAISLGGGEYHQIFRGFGCPECDYEWENDDHSETRSAEQCPRCNHSHPYRLNK